MKILKNGESKVFSHEIIVYAILGKDHNFKKVYATGDGNTVIKNMIKNIRTACPLFKVYFNHYMNSVKFEHLRISLECLNSVMPH